MFSLETRLEYHLQYNHYPAVHPMFVPVAIQAIECVECDEGDTMIEMPNGVTLSANQIYNDLHLEGFSTMGEEENAD